MPSCSIDAVLEGPYELLPQDYFAYCAAVVAGSAAGGTTRFAGIFVDTVGGPESRADWDVVHSKRIDPAKVARFEEVTARQYLVEVGAIAVMAAVLRSRDGLRIGNVEQIGTHADYTLVDANGGRVGVIEFAGVSSRYTSDKAARKRESVRRAKKRPARIGIVAFGGPELRSEVVA